MLLLKFSIFNGEEKNMDLANLEGGHHLDKLELVGKWKDEDTLVLVKEDKDAKSFKAVQKILKFLNYKQKDQMYYA